MSEPVANACAGPFGAFYDFYIERPWLVSLIGRAVWGMDGSVLYESMEPIGEAAPGSTIADVPCGGGVAFRALRPEQDVRYLAGDLDPRMLRRAERQAQARGLGQVECLTADMAELPFGDAEVDLFLSYSGLHMIGEPQRAIEEIARCLKPGGRVIGTAFFSGGSCRARLIFAAGHRRGHALPPGRDELIEWLAAAGLAESAIGPQPTFAAFSARKPQRAEGPAAGPVDAHRDSVLLAPARLAVDPRRSLRADPHT